MRPWRVVITVPAQTAVRVFRFVGLLFPVARSPQRVCLLLSLLLLKAEFRECVFVSCLDRVNCVRDVRGGGEGAGVVERVDKVAGPLAVGRARLGRSESDGVRRWREDAAESGDGGEDEIATDNAG